MPDEHVGVLGSLISDIEGFPEAFPAGSMRKQIELAKSYEEGGLQFTEHDVLAGRVYVGLSVLVRDMYYYLEEHPASGSPLFTEVVGLVNEEEAVRYGARAFPHYEGLPDFQVSALPRGLAAAAGGGNPTVAGLGSAAIVHEWTFKPGKRLFAHFLERLGPSCRDYVCGDATLTKGTLHDKAIGVALGTLATDFGTAAFWLPLAAYLGLGVAEKGLDEYCSLSANGELLVVPTGDW
ncbi:MAG: hypothetical protein OEM94_07240 [Acidimicrobiia bacterium]|nr:hypothetical protein [Acidimicrobiia bacterium]